MNYSLEGYDYRCVRIFALPVQEYVKVGFVAQSPFGEGGEFTFADIQLTYVSLNNLRKGK